MVSLFTAGDIDNILQGFFALLTGFITLWALSWASVIKQDDPYLFRILHLISGGILLIYFAYFLDITFLQFFFLALFTFVICIVSAELTLRIPALRDGKKVVGMQTTNRNVAKLRDRIDLERNAVLYEALNGATESDLRQYLQNAYDSIVKDIIPSLLKAARITKKFNVSLLVPVDDGCFRVKSSVGVSERHLELITEKLRWKDKFAGLAGYCFVTKENISVLDFSQPEFSDLAEHWVGLTPNEKLHDSFYANPIIFGNPEDKDSIVVGVLCVTVRGKNAWKGDNLDLTMKMISETLESLMYMEILFNIPE